MLVNGFDSLKCSQKKDKENQVIYPRAVYLQGAEVMWEIRQDIMHRITSGKKIPISKFKQLNKYLWMPLSDQEILTIIDRFYSKDKKILDKYKEITIFDRIKVEGRQLFEEIRFGTILREFYKKFGIVRGNYLDWGFGDGSLAYILDAYHNEKITYEKEVGSHPKDGIQVGDEIRYYSSDLKQNYCCEIPKNFYSSLYGGYIKPSIFTDENPDGKYLRFNDGYEVPKHFFSLVIAARAPFAKKQFVQIDKSLVNKGFFIYTTSLADQAQFNGSLLEVSVPINCQINIDKFVYNNLNYKLVDSFQIYYYYADSFLDKEIILIFTKSVEAIDCLKIFKNL